MSESTTTIISIFPNGLFILTMLFLIFLVGILLSVKFSAHRKAIGVGLITIGIIEILPLVLFYLGLNDVSYLIPFTPLSIIFMEGCITLVCGIVILYLSKPKKQ